MTANEKADTWICAVCRKKIAVRLVPRNHLTIHFIEIIRLMGMYAVVSIGGRQVRAEKGKSIRVPKLNVPKGEKVSFDKVLLVSDGKQVKVGAPTIEGYSIRTRVISHGKDSKIVVYKMKRRKGYQRKQGHRQEFTELIVEDIIFRHPKTNGKTKAAKASSKVDPSQIKDTTADSKAKGKRSKTSGKDKTLSEDKAAPSSSSKIDSPAEEIKTAES